MDKIFLWIGLNFTKNVFNISTIIQEVLWSSAELILVFCCLRIADFIRIKNGKKRIVIRYILFWCIVILNPILICTVPGITHDRLMLINFSILIYTAISERKDIIKVSKEIMAS